MFIQTEATADPATIRFLPGRTVLEEGAARFTDPDSARRSPLAERLFEVGSVSAVALGDDYVAVTKSADADWQVLKPAILGAIMDHFMAGLPMLVDEPEAEAGEDAEVVAEIKELLATRIRPVVAQSGGAVAFRGFREGAVLLEVEGKAHGLLRGIENMLRHYVPEVERVIDYRDALPKPGLDTPEAKAVQELLDYRINPAVATHGGHITLVDVEDATVYLRLEGGCQGCGMANVTLRQGVEVEIKRVVPTIRQVLDVTDHAGGTNPYYQPAK